MLRARLAPTVLLFAACGQPAPKSPAPLTRTQLQDPTQCQSCHPTQFADWSSSMHAYASTDPVFIAMNQRGERETDGGLGDFCLQCHQPMVAVGGLLPDAGPAVQGVTCYFCHSVAEVDGAHDDPLGLDGGFYGEIADPIAGIPHGAVYSALHDGASAQSAPLCGSCHDIVNGHGAYLERTFGEWLDSGFAHPPAGLSCSQCHMPAPEMLPVANVAGAPARPLHQHAFPAVDTALVDFPGQAGLRAQVEAFLQGELQGAVCVEQLPAGPQLQVIYDNVAAGHDFPSGASQDRRVWVDIEAADSDGGVFYRSGAVDAGDDPTQDADPDFWMLRDCMSSADGGPVDMFWQAFATEGNALPVLATFNASDPRFYQNHVLQTYPRAGVLAQTPARVTAQMYVLPIGLDVLNDLVASGDLDPSLVTKMQRLPVGPPIVWTAAAVNAHYTDPNNTGAAASVPCVSNGISLVATPVRAAAHTTCFP
ncbi:MAG: multiheme c-type cytochrome [Myxococcales bacterium]